MRSPEPTTQLLDDVWMKIEEISNTKKEDRNELMIIVTLSAFLSAVFVLAP